MALTCKYKYNIITRDEGKSKNGSKLVTGDIVSYFMKLGPCSQDVLYHNVKD